VILPGKTIGTYRKDRAERGVPTVSLNRTWEPLLFPANLADRIMRMSTPVNSVNCFADPTHMRMQRSPAEEVRMISKRF